MKPDNKTRTRGVHSNLILVVELVYNKYTNKYQNKTKMVQMNKISNCNIIFVVMFIYLIWMEVALYIKLQQLPSLADRYVKLFLENVFNDFNANTFFY